MHYPNSTASFLIADITGSNANVFFELGIAHATGKPVILAKLDNAVRNVLGSSLDVTQMFETARDLLKQFNLDSGFTHDQASRDEFHDRLIRAAETTGLPQMEDRVTAWLQKRGSDQ